MSSFAGQFSQTFADVTNEGSISEKQAFSTEERIDAIRSINKLRDAYGKTTKMRMRMQSSLFKQDAVETEKAIDIVVKAKSKDVSINQVVEGSLQTVSTQLRGIPDDDPSVQESQRQSFILGEIMKEKEKFMPKLSPRMISEEETNRLNNYYRVMQLTKNQRVKMEVKNAKIRAYVATGIQVGAIIGVGTIALSSLNLISLAAYLNPAVVAWLQSNLTTISYEVFMTVIPAAGEFGKKGVLAGARTVVTSLGTRYILENVDIKMAIVKTVAPGFDAMNLPFLGTIVGKGTLMITEQGIVGFMNGVAHFKTATEIAEETQANTLKEMKDKRDEFDKAVQRIRLGEYDPIRESREQKRREMEEKIKLQSIKNNNALTISKVLRIPIQVVKQIMKVIGYGWKNLRQWTKTQNKVAMITTGVVSAGVAAFMMASGMSVTDQAYQMVNGFIKMSMPTLVIQQVLTKTQLVPRLSKLLEDWVLRSVGKKDLAKIKPVAMLQKLFEKMLGRELDWQLKISTLVSMMVANQLAVGMRQASSSVFDLDNLAWLADRWDSTLVFTHSYEAFMQVIQSGSFEKFNTAHIFQSLYQTAGTLNIGDEVLNKDGTIVYKVSNIDYSSQQISVTLPTGQLQSIDVKTNQELDTLYVRNEQGRLLPITLNNMVLPGLGYFNVAEDLQIDPDLLTFMNKNDPQSLQTLLDITKEVKGQVAELERFKKRLEEMADTITASEKFIDSDMAYEPSTLDTVQEFQSLKKTLLSSIVRSKSDLIRQIAKDRSESEVIQYAQTMLGTLSNDNAKELIYVSKSLDQQELMRVVERIITQDNKWIASDTVVEKMTRRMIGMLAKDGPTNVFSQWSSFIKPLQTPNQQVLSEIARQFDEVSGGETLADNARLLLRSMTVPSALTELKSSDGKTLLEETINFMALQKAQSSDSLTTIQKTSTFVAERYPFYNIQQVKVNVGSIQWEIPNGRLQSISNQIRTLFNTKQNLSGSQLAKMVESNLSVPNIFDENTILTFQGIIDDARRNQNQERLVGPVIGIIQNVFARHVALEQGMEISNPIRNIVQEGMSREFGVVSTFNDSEWASILQSASKANFFPDYKSVSSMQNQRTKAMTSFNQGFYDHAVNGWEGLLSGQPSNALDSFKTSWNAIKDERALLESELTLPKGLLSLGASDIVQQKGWWKKAFELENVRDATFTERIGYYFQKTKSEYERGGIKDAAFHLLSFEGHPSDTLANMANQHRILNGMKSVSYSQLELQNLDTSTDPGLVYVKTILVERLPNMKKHYDQMKQISRTIDSQVGAVYEREATLIRDRQAAKNAALDMIKTSNMLEEEWKQSIQKVVGEMQKYRLEREAEQAYAQRFGININNKKPFNMESLKREVEKTRQTIMTSSNQLLQSNVPKINAKQQSNFEQVVKIDLTKDEIVVQEQKQQFMTKLGEDVKLAEQIQSMMVYSENYSSGLDFSLMTKFASLFGYGGTEYASKIAFSQMEIDRLKVMIGGYKQKMGELQQKLEQNPKLKDYAKCFGASYKMKWPSGEVDPPEYADCYMNAFAGSPSHTVKTLIVDGGAVLSQAIADLLVFIGPQGWMLTAAITASTKAALLCIKILENAITFALVSAAPKLNKMIQQSLENNDPNPTLHFWRFIAAWSCGSGGMIQNLCKGSNLAPGKLDGVPIAKFALRDVLLSSSSLVDDENFANLVSGMSSGDSSLLIIKSLWSLAFSADNAVVKTLLLGDVKSSHLRQYWDRWEKESQWNQNLGRDDPTISEYINSLSATDINLSKGVLTTMEQLATLLSYVKRVVIG